MKKRLIGVILSTLLTVTMATPAFAEIIWMQDKLPAGFTTNEWENKDFFLNAGNAVKRDTYTYYVKDLHGNLMKNAVFAGGSKTDGNGATTFADGFVPAFGTSDVEVNYIVTQTFVPNSWHIDSQKPLNQNGVSNYWYGDNKTCYKSNWNWLMVSPDGKKDGLKYAYCFNEYGYLYINTITPDGFMVNELGQLMIDGKVKTIDSSKNPGNKWYGYANFPIGALGYDYDSCGRAAQLWGAPNPFF